MFRYLVLALLLADGPPPQVNLPGWVDPSRPAPTRPAAPKVVQRVIVIPPMSTAGMHSHTCPYCRTTWSHGSSNHGNQAAHTCPNCQRVLPYPWLQNR